MSNIISTRSFFLTFNQLDFLHHRQRLLKINSRVDTETHATVIDTFTALPFTLGVHIIAPLLLARLEERPLTNGCPGKKYVWGST